MYGTIAHIRLKPGARDEAIETIRGLAERPDPCEIGALFFALDADPDAIAFAVAFESKDAYLANARRPETHARHLDLMRYAAAEPVWHDGEIVLSLGALGVDRTAPGLAPKV